jgi:hypothetical protein
VGVDAHLVHRVDGSGCGGSDASHLEDLGVGGGWGGELASGETERNADTSRELETRRVQCLCADVRERLQARWRAELGYISLGVT